jgi:serine protease DegS
MTRSEPDSPALYTIDKSAHGAPKGMSHSRLRQSVIFFGASALGGVLVAFVLMHFWPGLVGRSAQASDGVVAGAAAEQDGGGTEADADEPARAAAPSGASRDTGLLAQSDGSSFAPAVRRSAPAVVSIYTRRDERRAQGSEPVPGAPILPRYLDGLGSGVIVDANGHIITNQHVIQNWEEIRVQLADGREARAELVGSDPDTDLAVLQVSLPNLPVMQLGRSDRVAVGDVVLAIGNPLGLAQTVTAGIVSATGRADLGVATFEDFIQTDAAINDGNSGGALVNTRGELIGINTAVLGRNLDAEGIGIAIPVDMVRGVMREILEKGRVTRGWLGLVLEDVPEEYARVEGLAHGGVVISNFYKGSPALDAGLRRNDVIETIDGSTVLSSRDAMARIARRPPGSRLKLSGMRGQQRIEVELVVADSPAR